MDDEINLSPDYWDWDYVDPLTVGCLFGGTIEYRATDVGTDVRLEDCEFSHGLALTGEAEINDVKGTFKLTAEAGGEALTYERTADGELSATGDLP
jgi:hypothetical protein